MFVRAVCAIDEDKPLSVKDAKSLHQLFKKNQNMKYGKAHEMIVVFLNKMREKKGSVTFELISEVVAALFGMTGPHLAQHAQTVPFEANLESWPQLLKEYPPLPNGAQSISLNEFLKDSLLIRWLADAGDLDYHTIT